LRYQPIRNRYGSRYGSAGTASHVTGNYWEIAARARRAPDIARYRAGLGVRDIMGYCATTLLFSGVAFVAGMYLF
jgi:hypothetical protein